MYEIQYAGLKYYNSCISDECLYVGMLFNNLTTNTRVFKSIKNFKRLQSFDDEISIEFFKEYLKSIKSEVENNIFNVEKEFSMKDYVKLFTNELRFSEIRTVETEDNDFVEKTCKVFLRFDYDKSQRLKKVDERQFVKQLLDSKKIKYTNEPLVGKYDERIAYDVLTDKYGIKFFKFENKELKRLISNAKTWSFNAEEVKNERISLFLYDLDITESNQFKAIKDILKIHGKVMSVEEGIEYISSMS